MVAVVTVLGLVAVVVVSGGIFDGEGGWEKWC